MYKIPDLHHLQKITMQQKTELQINKACNENWNKMTVHQQGRFCDACEKMVVDFTAMSDEKLLAYFKNYDGNICGRFENEQLNRPLFTNYPTKTNWQKWTFSALFVGFLFVNRAKAQGKVILTEQVSITKFATKQLGKLQEVSGKVLDENGNGIPYASVIIKNENWGTATDSLGNFKLKIKSEFEFVELIISSVGYLNKEIKIDFIKAKKQTVVLKPQDLQDGVVVTGYGTTKGRIDVMGSVTKKSKEIKLSVESVKEDVSAMPTNAFKIYPNPAKAGSTVTLQFNELNNYLLRLVSLNGQILSTQNISVQGKQATFNLNIPAALSAGEYFVQIIGLDNRFQETNKLIVTH